MKRSEINKALRELEAMCRQEHCYLPPFCHFTPEEWKTKGHEYDEVRDLIDLFESTLYNMRDFEVQMVSIVVANMQSMEDRPRLEGFIDAVCPFCIARYASEDFMTAEREDFYQDIAANCNIPKTCLALLKGIKENPGSPYKTGSFALRRRTLYFLEHYVEPVGRIVNSMKASQYKQKFLSAYQQVSEQYRSMASQ